MLKKGSKGYNTDKNGNRRTKEVPKIGNKKFKQMKETSDKITDSKYPLRSDIEDNK
jgi:hypothetical protein